MRPGHSDTAVIITRRRRDFYELVCLYVQISLFSNNFGNLFSSGRGPLLALSAAGHVGANRRRFVPMPGFVALALRGELALSAGSFSSDLNRAEI